ncbi:MAG TPA: hypothetical protein VHE35_13475 [Kofleriaceae bacterium]|nr:hypothetical protein [Kofleriaceae bacterium]
MTYTSADRPIQIVVGNTYELHVQAFNRYEDQYLHSPVAIIGIAPQGPPRSRDISVGTLDP